MKRIWNKLLSLALTLCMLIALMPQLSLPAKATVSDTTSFTANAVSVTNPSGNIYTCGDETYIFEDVTVSSGDYSITAGTVNICGFQSGDTLAVSSDYNGELTGSYDSDKGILTISGPGTASDYQTFLQNITFKTNNYSADDSSKNTRTFEISLGSDIIYCEDTQHFYEYVSWADDPYRDTISEENTTEPTWNEARAAAASRTYTYNGKTYTGYLVTITSAEENDFITDKLGADAWIGCSDEDDEGYWRWVTGPEGNVTSSGPEDHNRTGQLFFIDDNNGGSAFGGAYTNWNSGEPNNKDHSPSDSCESYGEIYCSTTKKTPGCWNDQPHIKSEIKGYVVEYSDTDGTKITLNSKKEYTVITTPTVATNDASSISTTSATLNGEVTDNGGATLSEEGFYLQQQRFNTSQSEELRNKGNRIRHLDGNLQLLPVVAFSRYNVLLCCLRYKRRRYRLWRRRGLYHGLR